MRRALRRAAKRSREKQQ